jgi:type I restriction enzyme R subunit
MKGIMRWVRLHPYNISQKVQMVVEHFRENVAPLLNGKCQGDGGGQQPSGSGALATGHHKYIKSQGLQNGHAGGVLR